MARGLYTRGGGVVGPTSCSRGARKAQAYLCFFVDMRGRRGLHVVLELLHAVHGERWTRYTWPHTHGEGCTRRARGRSEQRATYVSKNIGIFCGCTLVAGLYMLSGGGTRGCGGCVAQLQGWAIGVACMAGCGFWRWRGLVVGARRVDVGLGSDQIGWDELGCQGGWANWGAKVLASGGCWESTTRLACQHCGGVGARVGGLRSRLVWESVARGVFAACAVERLARCAAGQRAVVIAETFSNLSIFR